MTERTLPRAYYDRSPVLVARDLLGKLLVRRSDGQQLTDRISEVEAYLGSDDPASHAFLERTERNAVLFGPPGMAYIYMIYGLHHCLNVSCLPEGTAGGVLFRSMIPLKGIKTMEQQRGLSPGAPYRLLASGPGRLCQALNLTRETGNNVDFTKSSSILQIKDDGFAPQRIVATARIGIKKAMDLPLRFFLDDAHESLWQDAVIESRPDPSCV